MHITAHGDDLVWRCSEIDDGTLCARKLGYKRLGVVSQDVPGEVAPRQRVYSADLVAGLAVDDTLSAMHLEQIAGSSVIRGSAAQDYFYERYFHNERTLSQNAQITGTPEERHELICTGRSVVAIYEQEYLPKLQAVSVQSEVSAVIGEFTLVGHVDLITKTELPGGKASQVIWDWKFTKKSPGMMPAKNYTRGWAYDMLGGDGSGQIGLIYLRKGLKTPKIESDSHFVTPGEHTQVRRQLMSLAGMYRQKFFPMAPIDSWICSPKWCEFHPICRGNPRGPAPIPGETPV